MEQPGLAVGERFALHFFEPRYKLLAQRVAESGDSRAFLYCASMPFASARLETSLFNMALRAISCSLVSSSASAS